MKKSKPTSQLVTDVIPAGSAREDYELAFSAAKRAWLAQMATASSSALRES